MTRYKKGLRQQVYDKFGGKCAYTGKALGEDWQIDHITSKNRSKYMNCYINYPNFDVNDFSNLFPALRIVNHYKRELDLEGFRINMLSFHKRLSKLPNIFLDIKRIILQKTKRLNIYSVFLRITKFGPLVSIKLDLRNMLSFHKRLSKLPKNTIVKRTMDRKRYMYAIADAFDITSEKPFSGKFYFETLK